MKLRIFAILVILLFNSKVILAQKINTTNNMEKPKIIYVYDALCGWCYGFSNVITQLEEKYNHIFEFEVISGGMVRGERIGSISSIAPYIKKAYKDVEQRSGVKFGEKFINETLEDESVIMSSIKPAIALSIIKEKYPERAVKAAAAIQKTFYLEGLGLDILENYKKLAMLADMSESEFINKMQEEKYLGLAEQDFYASHQLGVSGFPTLLLEVNGKNYVLSRGFTDYKTLENQFEKMLK